jgi:hypothetical protein
LDILSISFIDRERNHHDHQLIHERLHSNQIYCFEDKYRAGYNLADSLSKEYF